MTDSVPFRCPPDWSVGVALSFGQRARGLLGRSGLAAGEGLWLPARSVHTVGMRFALDLVWLGRGGAVLRVDRDVAPGRLRTCLRAAGGVIEVAAGSGPTLGRALTKGRAGGGARRGAYASSSSPSCGRFRDPR